MSFGKGIWLVLLLAGVVFSGTFGWEQYRKWTGEPAPVAAKVETSYGFSLDTLDGGLVRFEEFKGKVLLVNFWATWCAPCMEEFPSMVKLLDKFPDKMVMVAISADREEKDIKEFLSVFDGKRKNLIIAWEPGMVVARRYGTQALPETYLFSPQGELLDHYAGARDWSKPELLSKVAEFLKKDAVSK